MSNIIGSERRRKVVTRLQTRECFCSICERFSFSLSLSLCVRLPFPISLFNASDYLAFLRKLLGEPTESDFKEERMRFSKEIESTMQTLLEVTLVSCDSSQCVIEVVKWYQSLYEKARNRSAAAQTLYIRAFGCITAEIQVIRPLFY